MGKGERGIDGREQSSWAKERRGRACAEEEREWERESERGEWGKGERKS